MASAGWAYNPSRRRCAKAAASAGVKNALSFSSAGRSSGVYVALLQSPEMSGWPSLVRVGVKFGDADGTARTTAAGALRGGSVCWAKTLALPAARPAAISAPARECFMALLLDVPKKYQLPTPNWAAPNFQRPGN